MLSFFPQHRHACMLVKPFSIASQRVESVFFFFITSALPPWIDWAKQQARLHNPVHAPGPFTGHYIGTVHDWHVFFCTLSINHSFLTRESSICNLNLGQIEKPAPPWCQGTGFSVRQSSDPQSAQMNMVPYPVLQDQTEIFFFSSKLEQNRKVLLPSNLHVQPSREREMRTSRRSPSLAVPYSRP